MLWIRKANGGLYKLKKVTYTNHVLNLKMSAGKHDGIWRCGNW